MLILVVEDEIASINFICDILDVNNYDIMTAASGKEALSHVTSYCPDLLLLNLGLPDIDGIEVLKKIRHFSDVPVIIVSARGNERHKVLALDMGADDYITKPFGIPEFLARIRTAIRHSKQIYGKPWEANKIIINELEINCLNRSVLLGGENVHLTPVEYNIILLLSRHSGKVLTHDFILKEIWGPHIGDNQILRVNITNIRKKIPDFIITHPGIGYQMIENS